MENVFLSVVSQFAAAQTKRKSSVTNMSLENNLLTFRLNAPVAIRVKALVTDNLLSIKMLLSPNINISKLDQLAMTCLLPHMGLTASTYPDGVITRSCHDKTTLSRVVAGLDRESTCDAFCMTSEDVQSPTSLREREREGGKEVGGSKSARYNIH